MEDRIENLEALVSFQDLLIYVLHTQVVDLTMMSKIELGDDVIKEIKRLQNIIKEFKEELN